MSPDPRAVAATGNHARLRVADGPLVAPVLIRMVGMLAARAHCPVDRLDDALVVADAIAAAAPAHSTDGHVAVMLSAQADRLELRVEGLRPKGAEGIVADAALPGVGDVLQTIADEVRCEADALVVSLNFVAPG